MEKESVELILAQHLTQLSEGHQRNESTKHNDTAGEEHLRMNIAEYFGKRLSVNAVFYSFLHHVKYKGQQTKQKCFPNRRHKQGPSLSSRTKVSIFPDKNNFGDDKSVNQRKAVV